MKTSELIAVAKAGDESAAMTAMATVALRFASYSQAVAMDGGPDESDGRPLLAFDAWLDADTTIPRADALWAAEWVSERQFHIDGGKQ